MVLAWREPILYLIADPQHCSSGCLSGVVAEAIAGGVDVVQLRVKTTPTRELWRLAQQLLAITEKHQKILIINDRVDVAQAVQAAGTHLGQNSFPVKTARTLAGTGQILGVSVHNREEAFSAIGADYLLVSNIFDTSCKPGVPGKGIQLISDVQQACPVPLIALGGINETTIPRLAGLALQGVAVMSAILQTDRPGLRAQQLKQVLLDTFNTQRH